MIRLNSPDTEKRTEFIPEHACSHHFEIPGKKEKQTKHPTENEGGE